jgi:ribonuclease BN (tRNA processing enzyme)
VFWPWNSSACILLFMKKVRVTFLGAGDAFSAGGLNLSGYLVGGNAGSVLIDCGPTTLTRLRQETLDPAEIDTILISHLHGDHFGGIPYLLLDYLYFSRRHRPLTIAGPPGIRERIAALYAACFRHAASAVAPYDLRFVEMRPGTQLVLGDTVVSPFAVPHLDDELCLGFRVEFEGRTIAYSGDAGWTDALFPLSAGADLFICECSSFQVSVPFHLAYLQLRENRDRFACKRMVLSHLGADVLARRNEIEMELASDGLAIDL